MRFSTQHGITRTPDDDWFDPVVTADTPLYVDPFLVFEDPDPSWSSCRDEVAEFFLLAMSYVRLAAGDRRSAHWQKATRLLSFPEPKEFALGLSMGHPEGSGTGAEFAERMADALELLSSASIQEINYVEIFTLFCEGFGVDRISDAFCNIIKRRFIQYTQAVAGRHGLSTNSARVKHSSWSKISGRWNDEVVDLPESPAFRGGVILTPDRFLKDIPRVTQEGFWGWAEVNAGEMLRNDMNYDLSQSLSKADKQRRARAVAKQNPDLAAQYLRAVAALPHEAYDANEDSELLVGWEEAGLSAASRLPAAPQPAEDAFQTWVLDLANSFQHAVEETDLWKTFWNDSLTRPRKEKIVQAVASVMFAAHCKASDVDITRESNIGRGPVDFKFSRGWAKRALIEVKLIGSSHFFTGASKQLPQYLTTEKIACGYYLCVGFTDADFGEVRLQRVRDTCSAMSAQKGMALTPIFCDARPGTKKSASTLKEGDD